MLKILLTGGRNDDKPIQRFQRRIDAHLFLRGRLHFLTFRGHDVEHAVEQRHVEILSLPAAFAVKQRRLDRRIGRHAAKDIRHVGCGVAGLAGAVVLHLRQIETAGCMNNRRVGRALRVRPYLAKARNRAIHNTRIQLRQGLIAHP